jgi:signal transduction histidine kinase/ActR/RegA family two-component response regulator
LLGVALQGVAVVYGLLLLSRRRGAFGAWLFLLGAMTSMLVWRVVVLFHVEPPAFFNPLIAIWGSTCMLAAMFLFGREVARRARIEAERDGLLTSERAARSDTERAMRMKDEFLATLSHELRTPLAAILGWCSVLRVAGRKGEDIQRGLDTIERNAHAQARLIDDLLDVTRMQAGTLSLELALLRLDGPVQAALQSVRPAADAKAIAIELHCEEPVPVVNGDSGRLQQVVSNLLVNAVKFTPRHGSVRVSLESDGEHARLVVADTGEGIEPEFLPHLFTRFRQADGTASRRHGGLGLGLSIVSSLVRLHGGEVRAESAGKGKGATLTLTLPLSAGQPGARTPSLAPAPDAQLSLAQMRVLLVDDQVDIRSAVSSLLERLGARVMTLESGAEIEAAIAELQPHVLVIDISMPGEDGYSLIRRIRRLPAQRGGSIPAISLTAHTREEDRAHALACGFQEHLAKPLDVPLLLATIARLTQVERPPAALEPPPLSNEVALRGT